MNNRLLSLINRGYSETDIIELAAFTEEELEWATNIAFERISRNCGPVENKTAIFIGGQPGSGKTVMSMDLKKEIVNAVEIGIDNYRMYHPRYLEIEKCIKEHWKNRTETENDTPGNDIADFTHFFAGAMTDKLMEKCSKLGYNLILEWGMREPTGPLKSMKELKEKGYNNIVLFVSTHKEISYEACKQRADVMFNDNHIVRKVPQSFHDYSVETISKSVDRIYEEGYRYGIIDYMALVNRKGNVLWDDKHQTLPGHIYNNYLQNKELSNDIENNPYVSYINSKKEISFIEEKEYTNIYTVLPLTLMATSSKTR